MNRKLAFTIMLVVLPSSVFARDFKLKEIEEKAKQYAKKDGSSIEVNLEPPRSRFIDSSPKESSTEDKRHIMLHMKLANRSFSRKDYAKAIHEVESVFQRDPSHAGGHFMRAVIAGRQKDYETAWYHINIAKEKDSGNQKISDFISKLKTVSSMPETPSWIEGVYNGIQKNTSERTFDLLEKLLQEDCSQNITTIEVSDYAKGYSNTTNCTVTIKSLDPVVPNEILSLLRKANDGGVTVNEPKENSLELKITYNKIEIENKEALPISKINDFVTDLTEDMPEIAINNTEESEPKNGIQEIVYNLSAREFSSINRFMRKISKHSTKFVLSHMELGYIPGSKSTIWNAKIKVCYKLTAS